MIKSVVLADQHFGVISGEILYQEHVNIFYDYIDNNLIDVLFIAGDFFDSLLAANSRDARYAHRFMIELFRKSYINKFKIRIIYGTESHECNQYDIFQPLIDIDKLDIRVIRNVEEEELFEDFWVLYLPEEYMYNKKEYYKDYFKNEKKYNYVIGHGIIQELMSTASHHIEKSTKDSNRLKVPIFNSKELSHICKGEVYFGHYHVNSQLGDNIFYVGSFSRFCFGESGDKGFYAMEYDNDTYKHEFIVNTCAEEYISILYGYEDKIFKSEDNMLEELNRIDKLAYSVIDNIRMVVNIPETLENPESFIQTLHDRYKDNDRVSVKIVNGYIDKKHRINKEYVKESIEKYGNSFDTVSPIEDRCENFMKRKFDVGIPADRIRMHMDTNDILNMDKE